MLRLLFAMVLLAGLTTKSMAEEMSFEQIMNTFMGADQVEERMTTGRIEALNLNARTATIGGHRYHFGPSTLSTPLRVKMLGRDFGSLQLLEIGMDVRVYYFTAPSEHRIATELIQIVESEQH